MSKPIKLFGNVANQKITNPYRTSHFEVILQVINSITILYIVIGICSARFDYPILIQFLIKNACLDSFGLKHFSSINLFSNRGNLEAEDSKGIISLFYLLEGRGPDSEEYIFLLSNLLSPGLQSFRK